MARKNTPLFNLSFLDLLTSALGAVIFLFIITPKGGASAAKVQQLTVYLDTINHQVFGELPDSLWQKDIGDTLFTVLVDYKQMPKPAPAARPKPEPVKERPVQVSRPAPADPKAEKPQPVVVQTPTAPATPAPKPPVYRGDAPSVPCKVSFELAWKDDEDNVDLFVCKDGDCVYGARKRDRSIGQWDSGKSRNRLFGNDLRTNQEAVRQFDELLPGTYTLYAQFKESDAGHSSVTVRGLVYTKNDQGQERGEHFSRALSLSDDRVRLATVVIGQDGSIQIR